MEKKVLVTIAAAVMSSLGALHPDSACAADSAPTAYDDSTVDASLGPGEERVSADADNQTHLKDLRYAYFIGYNARAREDSKSYTNLGDEVKHPSKQVAAQATGDALKPAAEHAVTEHVAGGHVAAEHVAAEHVTAEHVAAPRRVVAQAAPVRQVAPAPVVAVAKPVPAPLTSSRRVVVARAAQPRQVVVAQQAAPVPVRHVPMQVASVPARREVVQVAQAEPVQPRRAAAAPVASLKQVSVQVAPAAPAKRVEVQAAPVKQVAARPMPLKAMGLESEPPILIPTQAVASLPGGKSDSDDDTPVAQSRESQNTQRTAASQNRQSDDDSQYSAEQAPPERPARQVRQYAAPGYNQVPADDSQPSGYSARQYTPPPPPPRTVQANQYAPAQYQPVYAQYGYVPRPPAQATAQQVISARPSGYATYDQTYTPPELRRPYPPGYGNTTQPPGYQGWE